MYDQCGKNIYRGDIVSRVCGVKSSFWVMDMNFKPVRLLKFFGRFGRQTRLEATT